MLEKIELTSRIAIYKLAKLEAGKKLTLLMIAAAIANIWIATGLMFDDVKPAYGTIAPTQTEDSFTIAERYANQSSYIMNETVEHVTTNPDVQRLKTQDPQFAAFADIATQCMNLDPNSFSLPQGTCRVSMTEGSQTWCGIENYNAEKCQHATAIYSNFTQVDQLMTEVGQFLNSMQYPGGGAYP